MPKSLEPARQSAKDAEYINAPLTFHPRRADPNLERNCTGSAMINYRADELMKYPATLDPISDPDVEAA
jgi:hypothetical protein